MHCSSPILAALLVCGPALAAPADYTAARDRAVRSAGAVRAAVAGRDAAVRAVNEGEGASACDRLAEAAVALEARWAAYLLTLDQLAQAAAPWPDEARAARRARNLAEAEVSADRAAAKGWRAACAEMPAVRNRAHRPPTKAVPYCGMIRHGEILEHRATVATAGDTLALTRWLSARLADEVDFLFALVHPSIDPRAAERASIWFDRGVPGVGLPPAHAPAHLPGWSRLHGVVVLSGAEALRRGPSLRGMARAFGNRWAIPGCSPTDGGWGLADVAGQLGGARELQALPDGRWRVHGVRPDGGVGLVGNGGNTRPFAPVERYLLGLQPLATVPAITFLKTPTLEGDLATADGVCRLDPAEIARRFGERPARAQPYTATVVVLSPTPLEFAAVQRYRRDALTFTAPGPDDAPHLFNLHEATGGLGRLRLVVPAPRGCATPRAALP